MTSKWKKRRTKRFLLKKYGKYSKKELTTWTRVALVFLVLLVFGMISTAIVFAFYAKDLPRPGKVRRSEGFSTIILDRNGEKLFDVYEEENRIPVKDISEVPDYLKQATIAIEDKNFYKHQGLSSFGMLRALINILVFHRLEGGSTLTQQLVKNVLLTQERTIPRKIKEAILALQIERKYSKDEILQMYLSEAPYGGTAVGVVAGADYYFGKPLKDLNLIESAVLAGLPQSPTLHSPFGQDPEAYVRRTEDVLRRMREERYISREEETFALEELTNVTFTTPSTESLRAPHFVAYVRQLLEEQFGAKVMSQGGLTVTTTLDWELQQQAQKIVREEVDKVEYLNVSNGASVILDPKNGEILSMVGSKDYAATDSGGYKYNVVTQGLRQPGSSIKPIVYAAAFNAGYTPATLLLDVETKYPTGGGSDKEYNPKNYDNTYRGPTHLRYALANSVNTIAVKVSALVGIEDILKLAYDMGIDSLQPTNETMSRVGLSLALGGGEVTLLDLSSAFGVFAANGNYIDPVAILQVEDVKGKVLYEHKEQKPKQVLKEEVAYLINHILSDNKARSEVFGTNSYLYIPGRTVAAKTGTTDDKRDNWTVGYTPTRVVGVWVGNNDNSPMHPSLASGLTGAAPIWNRLMKEALHGLEDELFIRPKAIMEIEIDALGGGTPVPDQDSRVEIFLKGTEPTEPAKIYQKVKVSKRDNSKLANSLEIAKGEYDEKSYIVFYEDDPVSTDGKNRWQDGINEWVKSQDNELYKVPTEEYKGSDEKVVVRFQEPDNEQRINDNKVHVRIEATGVNDIDKIELYLNGDLQKTVENEIMDATIHVNSGSYELKARAYDKDGNSAEDSRKIGVNEEYAPTVTPAPTSKPEPTTESSPTPSQTPSPTP